MDFDPTRMDELCNEERSLGSLFNNNMEKCADCVRGNGLNSKWYDGKNAQDTLRIVNLCQANFPTNHSNVVSAMSVIKKYGSVYGSIVPARTFTSATATTPRTSVAAKATTTSPSAPVIATTTSPSAPVTQDSESGSKAWIAGAVIGPIAAAAIVLAGVLIVLKRRKRRQTHIESSEIGGHVYEKSELPAEGRQRVELPMEHVVVEAPVKLPPQELESTVRAELPDSSKGP